MPQPKKGPRLGSGPDHQRQMLANLSASLFEHERIKTTEAKAKMLRPFAERLITKAKKGGIHDRRQVLSVIEDRAVVHKLFADIGPRFEDRNGGYTRILKLGPRNGDAAPMVLIELVEEGTVTTVTSDGDDEGGRRRRLRAPRRRREGEEKLPQDKPARSRAAEAAAAGNLSGEDESDEAGEAAEADEAPEAQLEAEEVSAEAATDDAETEAAGDDLPHDDGAGGVPEGNETDNK